LKRAAALAASLLLGGCLPSAPLPPQADEPALDPIAFFTGPSHGTGELALLTGKRTPIAVRSVGHMQRDGALRLDQDIREGTKRRTRRWVIRPLGAGRFTGSLTEAIGPVEATVRGNKMQIAYATNDYRVRQVLVLQADGTIANRLDVIKWGLNVARLRERISRT